MEPKYIENKYTVSREIPRISEEDRYKDLKLKKGDKLKAKFFQGTSPKAKIKECTFLEKINNRFLLVDLGAYKECITVRDIVLEGI